MVVLTNMIIYALITTSQHDWSSYNYSREASLVTPFDQAICYLDPNFNARIPADAVRRERIVVSIVFLGFGMINRVRRLHHVSNLIVTRIRNWVSRIARRSLMYCYGKGSADTLAACVAATFIYRPFLAVFLMVRLIVDGLASMAFEVTSNLQFIRKYTC
jgi:hypothetical protein